MVLRKERFVEGAKVLRRQKHVLSQSTTPFACTLCPLSQFKSSRKAKGKGPKNLNLVNPLLPLGARQGGHTITRLLRRVLETTFEKVLRRVLRRRLAVDFRGRKGSEKGS